MDFDILILSKTLNLHHVLYITAKASGPEGWSILSLEECAQQLSVPLSILFSKSFNSTSLPLAWKDALVTPINKKGDHTAVSNYRPISLTPHCQNNGINYYRSNSRTYDHQQPVYT